MKVYEMGEQQGLSSLTLSERPDLTAAPGQVVLKVRAVCLNHRDLLALNGKYGARKPGNRIPVSDGIGEVIALGEGVTNLAIGDRVICGHFSSWLDGAFAYSIFAKDLGITLDGWLAQQIVVPANALISVPVALSDEQAVALPAAGLTAWNALVEMGNIKAGDTVLALGTGGVSIFALQIAKMHGARVAITSSSDEKLVTARKMGADITVNYKTHPDWASEIMKQCAGADIIIETGGLSTLSQSITAAAPNGRIVLIGALASAAPINLPNFSTIIGKNLILCGITAGSRSMLQALVNAAAANGLTPVINRKFKFEDAPAAYAYLQSGDHMGKVMIEVA